MTFQAASRLHLRIPIVGSLVRPLPQYFTPPMPSMSPKSSRESSVRSKCESAVLTR